MGCFQNWGRETYTHATFGIEDTLAEINQCLQQESASEHSAKIQYKTEEEQEKVGEPARRLLSTANRNGGGGDTCKKVFKRSPRR